MADYVAYFLLFVVVVMLGSAKKAVFEQLLEILFACQSALPELLLSNPHAKAGSVAEGEKLILKKAQIEQKYPPGTWQRRGYEDFVSILLAREEGAKTFPCIYAGRGFRADEIHFMFLYSDDPSEPRNVHLVATALRGYLHVAKATGMHTSLVIVAPPRDTPKALDEYRRTYWLFAKRLHALDPKPWPSTIPEDTTSDRWCWAFEGIPCFMNVMSPAHEKRRTRHARNLCIVYQPKWIFEALFSTTAKRDAASKRVRDLIVDFDAVPISPDLTHYGTPGSSEARQHFLLDENISSPCPYPTLAA